MNSGDFDTKLDDALSRLTEIDPPELTSRGVSEMKDIVQVARRLQVLAPAPLPNLVDGRHKFLAEAERICTRAGSARRWSLQPGPRRLRAFAGSAVIALVVGVIVMLIAGSFAAGIPGAPGLWLSSTPPMRPTYTATPTQISLAPVDSQVRSVWVSGFDFRSSLPLPIPAPQAVASKQTLR